MRQEYTVKLEWDGEAAVWLATSDEIQGLALESDSVDTLVKRTLTAVPELLELNGQERSRRLHFLYSRHEEVPF